MQPEASQRERPRNRQQRWHRQPEQPWCRQPGRRSGQPEQRELQAQAAVAVERGRIARELHDVVAHHMSLIAVRAETAPYRLSDLSESARAEFGSLTDVAREALTEMRRLLGVLRQDQPAGLAPQPQLADLPVMLDHAVGIHA